MNPSHSNRAPVTINSAFDLKSCGLGVQRALVQLYLGTRAESEHLKTTNDLGFGGNLMHSPAWRDSELPREELSALIERKDVLRRQWEALGRKIFRVTLGSDPIGRDFSKEEFDGLILQLFNKQELSVAMLTELFKIRNNPPAQFFFTAARYGLSEERMSWFEAQQLRALEHPEIRSEVLKLHAKKLSLWNDLVALDIGHSNAELSLTPLDTGSWAKNWRDLFGEEMPCIGDLLTSSTAVVEEAKIAIRQGIFRKN